MILKDYFSVMKKKLQKDFAGQVEFLSQISMNSLSVNKESLRVLLTYLRDECEFEILIDLFGVDYPDRTKRFEVNYNLLNVRKNHRMNIKVYIGEGERVQSIVDIFSTAAWLERETWDMYGVVFDGNKDLRRLLTDYEFEGHPLRKDFPLTGYKEIRYDSEKRKVVYGPVNLSQEYRDFDFTSPWEGTNYKKNKSESDK